MSPSNLAHSTSSMNSWTPLSITYTYAWNSSMIFTIFTNSYYDVLIHKLTKERALKLKQCYVLNWNPYQKYGVSFFTAICLGSQCHTLLRASATRHKRTQPAFTAASEGWYSIYLPRRDGRLSWPIGGNVTIWFTRWQTVTHPSINRTRRRVTTSIETNAQLISQATNTGADLSM